MTHTGAPHGASSAARLTRALIVSAVTAGLVLVAPGAALAATGGTSTPPASQAEESALRIQAQEVAGQIDADGLRIEQLAEAYDSAQVRLQSLRTQQIALEQAMVLTAGKTAAARTQLKEQALLAYLAGGAPLDSSTPGPSARSDPTLTASYAEIIAGGRQRAIDNYRQVLADQSHQGAQLAAARSEAAVTLTNIQADRTAVNQTLASQKATLAQVRGRLATVVAQVEAARQKAQQAAVEASLARQNQLPPGAASSGPATPVATHTPAKTPATVATNTTVAPTNSRTSTPSPSAAPSTAPPDTGPPATGPPTTNPPVTSGNTAAPGAQVAINYARAQLGKPYQWGGSGPDSFDCSGLTMMAWQQAGVYLLHSAQDQYDVTRRISISQLLPGDLVFYGTPSDVHHVGLYIGNGNMIDAPETGEVVQIQSIFWGDLLGAGRV